MTRTHRGVAVGVAVLLLGLTGCGSIDLPDPPPVPTGPTSTPTRSSVEPPTPAPLPTHVTPTPSAYPNLSITGKTVCDLLGPEVRGSFSLGEPTSGDDTACFYPGVGVRKGPASDTILFLTADRDLAAWAAEQQDFTRWTTVTTDGTTGAMSAGGVQCHGAFAVAPDAILEVLVDPEEDEPLCARATDIMEAALAGLRAHQ